MRLVPIPQDILYARLKDALVSGKIGAIKEIVEASKPSFIKTKIAFTGALGHVDIHIVPQRNVSRISYSFNFKRFFLTFLLVDMLAYTILLSLTLSQYVPFQIFRQLTALTTIFGVAVPLYTYVDSKRRFSEQLEHLLQNIKLEYKHEYEKMTITLENLSEEARELYKKIMDKHSELYLNYKIKEYKRQSLSLEEAIRKIAQEEETIIETC